jgi:hypothetical protein
MEDLVICYDSLEPTACDFAKKIYRSLLSILEVQCREPNPSDKTTFAPSANNLAVLITKGCCDNPLVVQTIEKAVQTKKRVIYLEDLLANAKAETEVASLDEAVLKKLQGSTCLQYAIACYAECNDALLEAMTFSDPEEVQLARNRMQLRVEDDILRNSAKVSKLRLKAQVKRRNDFVITAAPNPSGEKTVLALRDIFDKRAAALNLPATAVTSQLLRLRFGCRTSRSA